MLLRKLLGPTLLLAASLPAPCTSKSIAANGEPGLVGTWRLMRMEDTAKDGKVTYPFGEHPLGYFVYDPTGHLSVQIMRTPPLKPFASGDSLKGTQAEEAQAWAYYAAYFGTYRVDKARHMLHHIVEGSLSPSFTNTDQLRPYQLHGDTLIIEGTNGKNGTHFYRELQRVR